MGSNPLGDAGPQQRCPERHLGQGKDQSLTTMSQKQFISQNTPGPEYTCQKWNFKKSTELCGLEEYIFSFRDKDGAFDTSPNLPTDLSI